MVLFVECGIGTKDAIAYLVPKDITQSDMDDYAWQATKYHGETYGIYPESEKPEDWDEEEHDSWHDDEYSDNIEGWWEEYDADKHDGQLIFGYSSNFKWNTY